MFFPFNDDVRSVGWARPTVFSHITGILPFVLPWPFCAFVLYFRVGGAHPTRLDNIFTNLRGEGKKEGKNLVWFSGGLSAKDPYMSEITPTEFSVIKKYLIVR